MKIILSLLFLALIGLFGVLVYNTFQFPSKQLQVEPVAELPIQRDSAIARFSKALNFKTTSLSAFTGNTEEMLKLHDYLAQAFPKTHAGLVREVIGAASLLYTWKGKDTTLKPLVLMGHIDVVPVIPGTEEKWTHPPFAGNVAGGYVWGRGAMDDKSTVMGILEAVETLLDKGFQPKRTVMLAFGHDEEVGGMRGAKRMTDMFREKQMTFEYVIDEGGAIVENTVPGIAGAVALVGIAEKGYLSVELSAEAAGGHSSMPPPSTAVGTLAEAIAALQKNPLPASLGKVNREFFAYIGPEMTFFQRLAFANLWLFEPLIIRALSESPQGNAIVRTTTAPTMLEASVKDNVLPIKASAVVNFRIHPDDSIGTVFAHIRKVTNNPDLKLKIYEGSGSVNPSSVSSTTSGAFQLLNQTIRQLYPNAVVAPYLVLGGTDAKHYVGLSENIYRFSPFQFAKDDMSRAHGTDERMNVESYLKGIQFYCQLLQNSNNL